MRTFSLAPQTRKYPRAVVEGLRGSRVVQDGQSFVRCVRCAAVVPWDDWPGHGSADTNPCVSAWQRQAATKSRQAASKRRAA